MISSALIRTGALGKFQRIHLIQLPIIGKPIVIVVGAGDAVAEEDAEILEGGAEGTAIEVVDEGQEDAVKDVAREAKAAVVVEKVEDGPQREDLRSRRHVFVFAFFRYRPRH